MKILWNQNPFLTTVELERHDLDHILKHIQVEKMFDVIYDSSVEEKELTYAEIDTIFNMDINHPEVVKTASFIEEGHGGDCTCAAMTCPRCVVEDMLDITTLPDLGKHEALLIQSAFAVKDVKNIDQAIEILSREKDYAKPENWPEGIQYYSNVTRWKSQRKNAETWLRNYKQTKGF